MIRLILQLIGLGLAGQVAAAPDTNLLAAGVRLEAFSGWPAALALSGGDCKAVVLPAVGGRIVHYSLNGEDLLYEAPKSGGKTLAGTPEGFDMGGYQCELGPEGRSLPEHRELSLGAWRWQASRPHVVVVESEPQTGLGLRMAKEIMMDPDLGEIGLQQRLTNVGAKEGVFQLWDWTACKGGGFGLVPLSKKSRYKAGWALARRAADGKTYYDGSQPADRRARVIDHVLVVEAKGAPLAVAADTDQEWVAYTVGRLLLVKYFPCHARARYPDSGPSIVFSCDEQQANLRPLSPQVKVAPGQSYVFPEKWVLHDLNSSVATAAEARALVKRIPPSPFKK